MKYILNSAVISTPGNYSYSLVSIETAKEWLNRGEYKNTLGYEETCQAFFILFGVSLEPNRELIKMETGDEALIFRLTYRLSEPHLKGKLSPEFVLKNCEVGLLRKK